MTAAYLRARAARLPRTRQSPAIRERGRALVVRGPHAAPRTGGPHQGREFGGGVPTAQRRPAPRVTCVPRDSRGPPPRPARRWRGRRRGSGSSCPRSQASALDEGGRSRTGTTAMPGCRKCSAKGATVGCTSRPWAISSSSSETSLTSMSASERSGGRSASGSGQAGLRQLLGHVLRAPHRVVREVLHGDVRASGERMVGRDHHDPGITLGQQRADHDVGQGEREPGHRQRAPRAVGAGRAGRRTGSSRAAPRPRRTPPRSG